MHSGLFSVDQLNCDIIGKTSVLVTGHHRFISTFQVFHLALTQLHHMREASCKFSGASDYKKKTTKKTMTLFAQETDTASC